MYESLHPNVVVIPAESLNTLDEDPSWISDTNKLLKAVHEEDYDALESLLLKEIKVNGHGGSFHETALHKASQQGWHKGLKLLLSHEANPNCMNQFGQTPLHYAVVSKTASCVKCLLEHCSKAYLDHKDMRGYTALHDASAAGFTEGISLLVKAGADINVRDKVQETPLHKAAKVRCVSSLLSLLNAGADLIARDKSGESVLGYILRHLPAGMDSILDNCLVPDSKISSKKLEVTLNFVPISGKSDMNQMNILSDIVDIGHPKLLLHPLCEAFLLYKWHNVRKLFFIEVIFYFIHAILATFLILDKFVWQKISGTVPEALPPGVFDILKIFLFIQVSFIFFKQVFTFLQGIRTWLFSFWHLLNGIIPILVFMVLPGQRTLWQHHFATITILLIWVHCMLHIGRFPSCGIYVAMFTRVAKVFLRIFLVFCCLLVAFTLSFYMSRYGYQYHTYHLHEACGKNSSDFIVQDEVYSNPLITFMKTLTWMMGELDFDSAFVCQLHMMNVTAHIIYFAFVILVAIILSNLLVALAVDDVQDLRNSAHLERLIKQMELVFRIERYFNSLSKISKKFKYDCLHRTLKKFVHDFSSTRIFVQPFHPLKSTKMVVVKDGTIQEIPLRKNNVANILQRLQNREEEISRSDETFRKIPRRVRSEYSNYTNDDNIFTLLKNMEINLLRIFEEKFSITTNSLNTISSRLDNLENLVVNDNSDDNNSSSNVQVQNICNPAIMRLKGESHNTRKSSLQQVHGPLNHRNQQVHGPLNHRHSYNPQGDNFSRREQAQTAFSLQVNDSREPLTQREAVSLLRDPLTRRGSTSNASQIHRKNENSRSVQFEMRPRSSSTDNNNGRAVGQNSGSMEV